MKLEKVYPTLHQRLLFYEEALTYIDNNVYLCRSNGLCYALRMAEVNILHAGVHTYDILSYFPELAALKPTYINTFFTGDGYWFKPGDWEPRAEILRKAIRMCKYKLKYNI